jgi:transposase
MEINSITKKELKTLTKNQLIEIILSISGTDDDQNNDKVPTKNSKNSSIPSSKDMSKGKSKKDDHLPKNKLGPKNGHKGFGRKISNNPDKTILCLIDKNPRTGAIVKSKSNSFSTHQIIELKNALEFEVININRQITTGEDGKTITAPNPPGIKKNVLYGPKLEAFIISLRYRYNMPWNKVKELIKIFGGEKISSGLLSRIFSDVKKTLKPDYDKIKNTVKNSAVVGADETGVHIKGYKGWGWTFRTEDATFYVISKNRSSKVPNAILGKDFKGILVSDFWGAYNWNLFHASGYQKCLSHLDRDFEFVKEIEKAKGIENISKVQKIFYEAIKIKKEMIFDSIEYKDKVKDIENRLDVELRKEDFGTIPGNRLRKRMIKYRDHLFNFLYHKNVPFHNNGSETDIRKFVGLRNVCGSLRSSLNRGPFWQSVIMSVIETSRKNDINYFDFIYQRILGNNSIELIKI